MDKRAHLDDKVVFDGEMKWGLSPSDNMKENYMHITSENMPVQKLCIPPDSKYMTSWQKQRMKIV